LVSHDHSPARGASTSWSKLGTGPLNAAINVLTVGPGGYIYAAKHGRGIWKIRFENTKSDSPDLVE
jgi:hypothetical protein